MVASHPLMGTVTVQGDLGWAGTVVEGLQGTSVHVEFTAGPAPGFLSASDVVIVPTDGRTATRVAAEGHYGTANIVVLDLVRRGSTRAAITAATQAGPEALPTAAAVLEAAGISASPVADVPGLILMRIVCQLASVAADAMLAGIASAGDIDLAMELGTSYPVGPLAWADDLGPDVVVGVLDNLAAHYGEERYRASPVLRRAAITGRSLHGGGMLDD